MSTVKQTQLPNITVAQDIQSVSGEVVGVKIGTLVSVYVNPAAATAPHRPRDANPYKFLDSYTFSDQDIFFGRESLSLELAATIVAHPTSLLLGKAAIGKTSLIHAGILPRLAREGNIAAFSVRDYEAPVAGIYDALRQIPNLSLSLPTDHSFTALASSFLAQTNQQLVIFFDQLERLFSMPLARQDEFAQQVAAANRLNESAASNRLHLVFVLREKFRDTASLLNLRVSDVNLLANVQTVPGLERDDARRAITEPLHTDDGLDRAVIEGGLLEEWVLPQLLRLNETAERRVDPAPLQIVCSRLYANARAAVAAGKQPQMSVELYKKLGQADGILKSYLSDQKTALAVSDDDWSGIRNVMGRMAGTNSLQFYSVSELARASGRSEANVQRWLEMLTRTSLVEARDDGAYALIGNYMIREIREWFPEQYNQSTANAALARVVSDWDDQHLLTERRRLRRIQEAGALLQPGPKAFALLLRSAVAYEANPNYWLSEITQDAPTQQAIQQLANGALADPVVLEVGEVLIGLQEGGAFRTLGEAVVQSPIENVRIAAALALSTLGVPSVLAVLQPYFSKGPLRQRWAALSDLAWIRFTGVRWTWTPLAVDPLIFLIVLGLSLRANRVKIASVAASALVGTALVGLIAALTTLLIAALGGFRLANLALEFILLLAVAVTNSAVIGLSYGIADVSAPRTHPRALIALRLFAIISGFAVANAFVIGAQTNVFPDPRSLFIGALVGSGFAIANEIALARFAHGDLKRILLSAAGLALTSSLATVLTITFSHLFELQLILVESLPWRFAGGVSPQVFASSFREISYVIANAIMGAIIGIGLAMGLIIGDRLADQLERARYV